MRRLTFAVSLFLVGATLTAAETRQHFAVTAGTDRFSVTRIDRAGDPLTTYTALIRDEKTGRSYRLEAVRNYAAQTLDYKLVDLQAAGNFIAAHYQLPLVANGRAATRAEERNPSARQRPVEITLSSRGTSVRKTETEWHDLAMNATRASLTAVLPDDFKALIGRLQTASALPQLNEFCADFLAYFAAVPDCRPAGKIRLVTLPPDCSFDAKHGEACSDVQAANAKASRMRGEGRFY